MLKSNSSLQTRWQLHALHVPISPTRGLQGEYRLTWFEIIDHQGSLDRETKLVEVVVKGVANKKLADLIATYQIPVPFSLVHFRDIVVQFAQWVPQITQEKAEVLMVAGTCFRCNKPGHIANDCVQSLLVIDVTK